MKDIIILGTESLHPCACVHVVTPTTLSAALKVAFEANQSDFILGEMVSWSVFVKVWKSQGVSKMEENKHPHTRTE